MTGQLAETARRYEAWLRDRPGRPCLPIEGLATARHLALDRSSLEARGWTDLPADWTPPQGEVHAGGYGEERAIYDTPIFNRAGEEPRTVHLGLDVFAEAGTPVFAPLAARVHSVQLNNNAKDYGPTLILRHKPAPGVTFWTLYGHLAADVLDTLKPDGSIAQGQQIASLGDTGVNGGWAPHLHFQVMLDLEGRSGDFPGVARKSEAARWLSICPDPKALLGL